ncbi:uncharacterized protein LOC143150328 [Ptiloglossa arizonensis]|uniref:uncharacterized protein LOC143150328 n=1 Tax=Ptiloglossa arizonensis TaxID=3350558 RepID=UPI003FA09F88
MTQFLLAMMNCNEDRAKKDESRSATRVPFVAALTSNIGIADVECVNVKMFSRSKERLSYYGKWSVIYERIRVWKIPILMYTASTVLGICWLTDWKVVCKRIPFYGSKYERGSSQKRTIK